MINDDLKLDFQQNGFFLIKKAIEVDALECCSRLNRSIRAMAESISTPEDKYLQAVSRWDSPCAIVQEFTHELQPLLEPVASTILDRDVEIIRSSIIRKSVTAARPTHGHQDAGYWLENASSTYDLSTWIALEDIDESNGALRVLPGSHKAGVIPQQDFLAKEFIDPALSWGDEAVTLNMSAGDVAVFSPYLWHASHSCQQKRTRTALVLRWAGQPPVFTFDDAATLRAKNNSNEFGMSTSGKLLDHSLCLLAKSAGYSPEDLPRVDLVQLILSKQLTERLPASDKAIGILNRLLILIQAKESHHGNDLGAGVWEGIRDLIVEPCINLEQHF